MKNIKYFLLFFCFIIVHNCTAAFIKKTDSVLLSYIYIDQDYNTNLFANSSYLINKLKHDKAFDQVKVANVLSKKIKTLVKQKHQIAFLTCPVEFLPRRSILITNAFLTNRAVSNCLVSNAPVLPANRGMGVVLDFKFKKISENFGFAAAALVLYMQVIYYDQQGMPVKVCRTKQTSTKKVTFAAKRFIPPELMLAAMQQTIDMALTDLEGKMY
ncbi:MAG TPA: hypothetical protein VKS21_11305 [Spirochaetota bacterium]|nr:hypothetical protein [Spirochaetota bacterium]